MRGISWLAANRLDSQEGLCYMEWLSKPVCTLYQPVSLQSHYDRRLHLTGLGRVCKTQIQTAPYRSGHSLCTYWCHRHMWQDASQWRNEMSVSNGTHGVTDSNRNVPWRRPCDAMRRQRAFLNSYSCICYRTPTPPQPHFGSNIWSLKKF